MFNRKRKLNRIKRNCINIFVDEAGNPGYTVLKDNQIYKIPQENIFFEFPGNFYEKGKCKGYFYRFERKSSINFYAIYKTQDGKLFTVNDKMERVKNKI